MTPPRCPGGTEYRTANLAKRHAWWLETDRSKRQVPAECCGHWHLKAAEQEPDALTA